VYATGATDVKAAFTVRETEIRPNCGSAPLEFTRETASTADCSCFSEAGFFVSVERKKQYAFTVEAV
jgi:hypothetical protein